MPGLDDQARSVDRARLSAIDHDLDQADNVCLAQASEALQLARAALISKLLARALGPAHAAFRRHLAAATERLTELLWQQEIAPDTPHPPR